MINYIRRYKNKIVVFLPYVFNKYPDFLSNYHLLFDVTSHQILQNKKLDMLD